MNLIFLMSSFFDHLIICVASSNWYSLMTQNIRHMLIYTSKPDPAADGAHRNLTRCHQSRASSEDLHKEDLHKMSPEDLPSQYVNRGPPGAICHQKTSTRCHKRTFTRFHHRRDTSLLVRMLASTTGCAWKHEWQGALSILRAGLVLSLTQRRHHRTPLQIHRLHGPSQL